jgi:hypothetical protein
MTVTMTMTMTMTVTMTMRRSSASIRAVIVMPGGLGPAARHD